MAIIVFQHGRDLGAGRLGLTLRDHGFQLDFRHVAEEGPGAVPPDYDNVQGVISLPGEQNVTDIASHAWMQAEAEYLKGAHARALPVIGVCFGSQLIAHALGGTVGPCEKPEWGFAKVSIQIPGQTEAMLAGMPWESHQFHAHNQEVKELPPGAVLLASSAATRVQAYKAGLRTYAFQYHFEADREGASRIVEGAPGGTPADFEAQLAAHYEVFARTADRLSVNLAALAFPMQRKRSA